jgi:hypothetical protein
MATTIRNDSLFCLCCGGSYNLNYPISVDTMLEKTKAFTTLHEDCKQTWVEPTVNPNGTLQERALWWIANGHAGTSSKTMWNCFMGNKHVDISHPYDPDDFSRCYKLLQAVPEWKSRMYLLKKLSPQWSNLVDNWEELTRMYERNVDENFKNWKQVGMGKLMEKLIS